MFKDYREKLLTSKTTYYTPQKSFYSFQIIGLFNEILIQTSDRARLPSGAKTDIQKGLTMSFPEQDFLTSLRSQPRDDGLMSSHKQLKIDGCCSLVAQSSKLQILLFIIIVNLNYYHRVTAMGDNK